MTPAPPLIVLDDDPTGTQTVAGVPVALAWDGREIASSLRPGDRAIHVLTNTRAHGPEVARRITASAARAARRDVPGARLILRGDSTLRGHVWEEYEAVRSVVDPTGAPPLLLVPALPAAGRVTRGGVHWQLRDGGAVPLAETEYACDGAFAYRSSRLVAWADERSGGRLLAADGIETGPHGTAAALAAAARCGRPAVVVPDAETEDDLIAIADGLRAAWERGVPALVRCAPPFAGLLAGTLAAAFARLVPPRSGALVVCGSFVPATTAQLAELERRLPGLQVEIDPAELAAGDAAADRALDAAARVVEALLAARGCAIVATSRARHPDLVPAERQLLVAKRLADIVRRLAPPPGVVVAKGGITGAVTAGHGLGARTARVVGPVATGVSLWRLDTGADYLVIPGNVGGPGLLADLVERLVPNGRRAEV